MFRKQINKLLFTRKTKNVFEYMHTLAIIPHHMYQMYNVYVIMYLYTATEHCIGSTSAALKAIEYIVILYTYDAYTFIHIHIYINHKTIYFTGKHVSCEIKTFNY